MTTLLSDMSLEMEELKIIQARVNAKRAAVMAELRRYADTDSSVCVLTHRCNHAYNDSFGQDEWGRYVMYKGQNVSRKFDRILLDNAIPKHLIIMKGAACRMPPVFSEKASATDDEYFYGAKVIRVRRYVSDTNQRVVTFKIYFDITATPPGNVPQGHNFQSFYQAFQHKNKLHALISNGFVPVNLQFAQGIIMCNTFKPTII